MSKVFRAQTGKGMDEALKAAAETGVKMGKGMAYAEAGHRVEREGLKAKAAGNVEVGAALVAAADALFLRALDFVPELADDIIKGRDQDQGVYAPAMPD